jgi:5-formyltetrahydrofolate cyclo-ligase
LSESQNNYLSELVIQNILSTFDFKGKTVALFLPIISKKEVNTYSLIDHLEKHNVKWCIPSTNLKTWELTFFSISDDSGIQPNRIGIPEAVNGQVIPALEIDVCITPLLAHDLNGFRIGYGKGCYDRFFLTCNQNLIKIGITTFDQPIKEVEIDDLDVRLNYCVTPFNIYEFQK